MSASTVILMNSWMLAILCRRIWESWRARAPAALNCPWAAIDFPSNPLLYSTEDSRQWPLLAHQEKRRLRQCFRGEHELSLGKTGIGEGLKHHLKFILEQALIVIAALLCVCCLCLILALALNWNQSSAEWMTKTIEDKYNSVLCSLVEVGSEETLLASLNRLSEESHQSVAMLLDSEVMRYVSGKREDESAGVIVRFASCWLLEHADDDGDGVLGWGLKKAWGPFGAELENPANHEYAIETAQVLNALMNASETDALSSGVQERIREIAVETVVQWSRSFWSSDTNGGVLLV